MFENTPVIGRSESAELATNRVLRNTYAMLGLTMIPTVLGAFFGVSIDFSIVAMHPFIAFGVFMAVTIGMQTAISAHRNSGLGIVLLLAYTFFLGLMLGPLLQHALHMRNGGQLVALAAAGTGIIFLTLATIASAAKRDFSFLAKFLTIGVVVVFLAIIANLFLHIPALSLTISTVFILISSGFILYEVNQIVRGGETNYIMATLSLFISIYNIFSNLLRILMSFSRND